MIVGGQGSDYDSATPCVADAEEYNPSTGSFGYAGTELGENCYPVANLLPDGRVLIDERELYLPSLRAASAASLDGPLAPESVASLFGSQLASTTQSANVRSPVTSLGGISLRVHDSSGAVKPASLFLISPAEIRFEVPPGVAPGDVTLELQNTPVPHNPVTAHTGNVAPGLFSFDDNMVASVVPQLSARAGTVILDVAPVELVLYGTGIRNRSTLGNVPCTIGGTPATVDYAGPDPSGVPGLDQVRVIVPSSFTGRGLLDVVLTVDGVASNMTSIQVVGGGREAPAAGQGHLRYADDHSSVLWNPRNLWIVTNSRAPLSPTCYAT